MKNKKRLAAILIGLSVLSAGLWWTRPAKQAPEKTQSSTAHQDRITLAPGAPQLAYIQTVEAALQLLPVTDRLNARIALDEGATARVYAPLAGRVLTLHCELGDKVRKGTPLATLDSPDFGTALSDMAKADADAARKDRQLARAKLLLDGEVMARRDYESAEADAKAARAEADRARLRIANLVPGGTVVDGQRLVLRAPMDGVVADRQVNPGTEVQPASPTPLFTLSNLSSLWLLIDLPEKDLGTLKVGEPVIVSVDAYPNERFTAKVERVSPLLDPSTRRVQVRARLDNAQGRFRPEMFARVSVAADDKQQALRLPLAALITEGLYAHVFVEAKPGEFVKRRVQVLRQDSEFAYLKPGAENLNPGDRIVVKGALLLNAELASGN